MVLSLVIVGGLFKSCQHDTPKVWLSSECTVPPVSISPDEDKLSRGTKQSILKTNRRLEAVCYS